MSKVVYVTGCLGFIGSHVTRELLYQGYYVRGVDKESYASNVEVLKEFLNHHNFTYEKKDINDLEFLYECDYVINTAAETHVGNSIANSNDFVHSNIDGVHHLLELIKNYRHESDKKPVFLHFSTDEVYGDIEGEGSHTELDLLKPSNPYSATKAAADMLVLAWSRTYNLPYVIVRPTNNYGKRQYVEKLIPKTCKYLKLGKRIPLHNNGTPIRSWLHAYDTAGAIHTIIESGKVNEIYNIAAGYEQSNIDTVTKVFEAYKSINGLDDLELRKFIDTSYSRPGQDVRYSLDDTKLRSLGWQPTIKFDLEIKSIVEYYNNQFVW